MTDIVLSEPVLTESNETVLTESNETVLNEPVLTESNEPVLPEPVLPEPVLTESNEPVLTESNETGLSEIILTDSSDSGDLTDPSNTILTDPSNTVVKTNFIEKSITSLIIRDKLMKSQVNLTPELIATIKNILSVSPDTFNDIEKAIGDIIKDGKIDSKDIPQFMIVVQKIYQIVYSLKDTKKHSEMTCSVLKFVVHLLVLERKIIIDEDKETQFLTDCDLLIDACIGLLNFPKSIKTKGCLQKLFS